MKPHRSLLELAKQTKTKQQKTRTVNGQKYSNSSFTTVEKIHSSQLFHFSLLPNEEQALDTQILLIVLIQKTKDQPSILDWWKDVVSCSTLESPASKKGELIQ